MTMTELASLGERVNTVLGTVFTLFFIGVMLAILVTVFGGDRTRRGRPPPPTPPAVRDPED